MSAWGCQMATSSLFTTVGVGGGCGGGGGALGDIDTTMAGADGADGDSWASEGGVDCFDALGGGTT